MFDFLYNHLDSKYKKQKTLKDKKTYMKELIKKSEGCKKGMLVKLVHNTYYLKGLDECKKWFSQSCPVPESSFFDDSDLDDDFLYRNDEMPVYDVYKNLFYQYIKHNACGYKNYFGYIEVIQWVQCFFLTKATIIFLIDII